MRDQLYDNEYQQGRNAFHDGIDRAVRAIGRFVSTTFGPINAVQFDAPWRPARIRKSSKRTDIA